MPQPLLLEKHHGYYSCPVFEKQGARVLWTTRVFDMSFEAGERPGAYKALGIDPRRIAIPHQAHGDKVVVVGSRDAGRGALTRSSAFPETDAVLTNRLGQPIGVLTADCLPVLVVAPGRRGIAAIHAGWRGMEKHIIRCALDRMRSRFGIGAHGLSVVLGPAIRACCYEVGQEFCERFPRAVKKRDGRLYFDIIAAAREELDSWGVRPGAIFDSGICTCCAENEFFSYRRQGARAGRSMSILEIV